MQEMARVEEFCFSLVRNRRFLIVFLGQKRSKTLRGNRRFVRYFVVFFMEESNGQKTTVTFEKRQRKKPQKTIRNRRFHF